MSGLFGGGPKPVAPPKPPPEKTDVAAAVNRPTNTGVRRNLLVDPAIPLQPVTIRNLLGGFGAS